MRVRSGELALLALLAAGPVHAQLRAQEIQTKSAPASNGVYVSPEDYQRHVLSSAADCKSGRQSINLHTFWNRPYIDVKSPGAERRFYKREIFGFRDCEGRDFRFVDGQQYRVVESGPIYLYTQRRDVRVNKGSREVTTYFFSVTPGSGLLPLTKDNLMNAYPENHRFHDLLDAAFHSGGVEEYDDFHHMYKVNHLFLQSQ